MIALNLNAHFIVIAAVEEIGLSVPLAVLYIIGNLNTGHNTVVLLIECFDKLVIRNICEHADIVIPVARYIVKPDKESKGIIGIGFYLDILA
jgi:hypothetical protein